MFNFRDLSFRYKIPLRGTLLVVITAVMVTGGILLREYEQIRQDLYASAGNMGRVLAKTLITPLRHDDTWRAYEIISTPLQQEGASQGNPLNADLLVVLDARQRIYVSTRPTHYPILVMLSQVRPEYAALEQAIAEYKDDAPVVREIDGLNVFHLIAPIRAEDALLGYLVIEYPKSLFLPRFLDIVERALLVTLIVLALILPVSWYWGRRMADPLVNLAKCIGKVGPDIPEPDLCDLYESRDEIGLAGTQLRQMLAELRNKQTLEREVMANERLAAVGRLSAGIAHEINNPLGGMLNAISTYKRHAQPDTLAAAKTLSLIERGLLQVKQTVAALLVEARVESHALRCQDVEDIHTLIVHDAQKKHLTLHWENGMTDSAPLPSTQIRQILLNLLLNAVQASPDGGHLECHIDCLDDMLHLRIINEGEPISPQRMEHLFEPFAGSSGSGHGLGLWVTYQLVQQLNGGIEVASGTEHTCFTITLPYRTAA